jgi:hypothetical protein
MDEDQLLRKALEAWVENLLPRLQMEDIEMFNIYFQTQRKDMEMAHSVGYKEGYMDGARYSQEKRKMQ